MLNHCVILAQNDLANVAGYANVPTRREVSALHERPGASRALPEAEARANALGAERSVSSWLLYSNYVR